MKQINLLILGMTLVFFTGCRESYDPPAISSDQSFLVVEGALNAGAGSTSIHLTRTYKLDESGRLVGELNATVTVEGDDGSVKNLTGMALGYYTSPALNLSLDKQYRLRIKTQDGLEYLSDFVTAKKTPPIDTITWKRDNQDLQLFVSTHDPANASVYYRWEFDETWEITSYYYSTVIYEKATNTVRDRIFPQENVFNCWKYASSNRILIGNSARLDQDVINDAPIAKIGFRDERIEQRYSMLLRQYALSASAYAFYEIMKKNTEELGTVFGPLPAELRGNIRCVSDPDVYVLGFITASTAEEKRIFISSSEVPGWNLPRSCIDSLVSNNAAALSANFKEGIFMPYSIEENTMGGIIGYHSSTPECVDCTKRGGSNQKPIYW